MARKRSRSKKATKRYQIELTPLSVILWAGCSFFVLAWIFVLGILVGRGFLPDTVTAIAQLKGQISALQGMLSRDESRDLGPPKRPKADPKLVFYEKLSSKKDEAKKEWVPERQVKAPSKDTTQRKINRTREAAPEKTLEDARRGNLQHRGEISAEPQVEGEKGQGMALSPRARYTVQLASLDDKIKAERVIHSLIGRGYPAYYYEAKVQGRTYYRVRCGRFETRKEASKYARKLKKEAGIKGFVSKLE